MCFCECFEMLGVMVQLQNPPLQTANTSFFNPLQLNQQNTQLLNWLWRKSRSQALKMESASLWVNGA